MLYIKEITERIPYHLFFIITKYPGILVTLETIIKLLHEIKLYFNFHLTIFPDIILLLKGQGRLSGYIKDANNSISVKGTKIAIPGIHFFRLAWELSHRQYSQKQLAC